MFLENLLEHEPRDSVCQNGDCTWKMNSNRIKEEFPVYKVLNSRVPHPSIKMPAQRTDTQVRLDTLATCFAITVDTLEILANTLNAAFLEAISNTARSLLKNVQVSHF
jgi:hypothetical protein